jgi:hypothetical protein
MAIDTSGEYWRGTEHADLAEYLRDYAAGGYPVDDVTASVCAACGGRRFRVHADHEEGCVQRTCVDCAAEAFVADSADAAADATLEECECPCGADEFAVVVGFARLRDGEVRWISVGLRCLTDGTLGVYADWKIDYLPSTHLLTMA